MDHSICGVLIKSLCLEPLESYSVLPSGFDRMYLVSLFLSHIFGLYFRRNAHDFKWVRRHEKCKSVSAYVLACELLAANNAMRSGLEISSGVDLTGLSQLEGEGIWWDLDLSLNGLAISGI